MCPFMKSLCQIRRRHGLYAFPVLPQYASMAGTQNQMGNNPLDLLAGCTRVVAGCHRKKRYSAPFLRQRTKSKAYEGVGKGSACRSHCYRPFTLACCVPLGFLGAVGLAGVSVWAQPHRTLLLGASVALLFLGFALVAHPRPEGCAVLGHGTSLCKRIAVASFRL